HCARQSVLGRWSARRSRSRLDHGVGTPLARGAGPRTVQGDPSGPPRGRYSREGSAAGVHLMKAAEGRTADGPAGQLVEARAFLLKALARIPADRWSESPSPSYSPVGWHLGHVAATQARWLLPGDPVAERFGGFFDPSQTSKTERSDLPAPEQLLEYLGETLETVRRRLWDRAVPAVRGLPHDFLVHSIAQHELQHGEHVRVIAALCERRLQRAAPAAA